MSSQTERALPVREAPCSDLTWARPSGRGALLRRGRERGRDAVEHAAEVRAHQRHSGDDDHRNQRRDEAVLDRRRAILVAEKLTNKAHLCLLQSKYPGRIVAPGQQTARIIDFKFIQVRAMAEKRAIQRLESIQFYCVNVEGVFFPEQ